MELKLNIYADRLCRKVEREATANDFELSTGICEDVLNIINIDMFEGGLEALTDESMQELAIGIVKNGYPYFVELIKEIFEISDDEAKRIKVADVAKVMLEIVKYSFAQLTNSLGGKKSKN
ncbi:MAG: hypothetical protein ACI4MS_02695 [Candidatus Coproplasma sp.]